MGEVPFHLYSLRDLLHGRDLVGFVLVFTSQLTEVVVHQSTNHESTNQSIGCRAAEQSCMVNAALTSATNAPNKNLTADTRNHLEERKSQPNA